jgi:Arc/MetJ-type ribon-helix-helix transcriptional regulator
MTHHVPITPPIEELLRQQLATGRFESASEVLSAALRQLEEQRSSSPVLPDESFGLWTDRFEDGLAYQHTLRAEWAR